MYMWCSLIQWCKRQRWGVPSLIEDQSDACLVAPLSRTKVCLRNRHLYFPRPGQWLHYKMSLLSCMTDHRTTGQAHSNSVAKAVELCKWPSEAAGFARDVVHSFIRMLSHSTLYPENRNSSSILDLGQTDYQESRKTQDGRTMIQNSQLFHCWQWRDVYSTEGTSEVSQMAHLLPSATRMRIWRKTHPRAVPPHCSYLFSLPGQHKRNCCRKNWVNSSQELGRNFTDANKPQRRNLQSLRWWLQSAS